MTLAQALYDQLRLDAGVAAIAGTRIYPKRLPQLAKGADLSPSLAFALVGRDDEYDTDGLAVKKPSYGIFAIADTYAGVHELADAVEACLMPSNAPFVGTLGGGGGVAVQHVSLTDSQDIVDSDDIEERGWHAIAQLYEIWLSV